MAELLRLITMLRRQPGHSFQHKTVGRNRGQGMSIIKTGKPQGIFQFIGNVEQHEQSQKQNRRNTSTGKQNWLNRDTLKPNGGALRRQAPHGSTTNHEIAVLE